MSGVFLPMPVEKNTTNILSQISIYATYFKKNAQKIFISLVANNDRRPVHIIIILSNLHLNQ